MFYHSRQNSFVLSQGALKNVTFLKIGIGLIVKYVVHSILFQNGKNILRYMSKKRMRPAYDREQGKRKKQILFIWNHKPLLTLFGLTYKIYVKDCHSTQMYPPVFSEI